MGEVLIVYFLSLLLCAAGYVFGFKALKKKCENKIRFGALFCGVIASVAFLFLMMLLFKATFNNDNYYNTALFHGLIGSLYVFLISTVTSLLVKALFFGRYKSEAGYSFLLGFGAMPSAFLSVYLLIMSVSVVINGLFNGPCTVENGGLLHFEDNTMISVFQPVWGHISFAVLFLMLGFLFYWEGVLLQKISETKRSLGISILWICGFHILKAIAITVVPFMSLFRLTHWQLAIIVTVFSLLSFVFVFFMPKAPEQTEYTKQFE